MRSERGVPARRLDELRLAFMLLSRIPMGSLRAPPLLARCFWAYPLVGAAVGAAVGLVLWGGLAAGLPPQVAGVIALAASVILTGAMHEDGLADTADGFGGGDSAARKLAIMHDSRIGTYGVLALFLACGLRVLLLAELQPGLGAVLALALIGALSRAILPVMMVLLPPARTDGLGRAAAAGGGAAGATAGFGVAAGVAVFALEGGFALLTTVVLMALVMGALARRQIGGVSGDVLGATQVLAETVAVFTLIVLFSGNGAA